MIHRALKHPTLSLPPQSHPMGDWMPSTVAMITERAGAKPLTFIWHDGLHGQGPTEICTGSQPDTYHVRLASPNGVGDGE